MGKQFRTRRSTAETIEFEVIFEEVVPNEDNPEEVKTEERTEAFHAVPECPGKWLMEIGASMAGKDGERAHAINNFLNRVIVKDEQEHWNEVLQDTTHIIDIDLLGDIVNWLMEEYGDRPTGTSRS